MEELASLVVRARDGDSDAFAALVRRFQDLAVGYSYSLLGDLHLAEDVAQEAFLESYLRLPQLREPAAFPGWFRRIVFKFCDRLTRGVTHDTVPIDNEQERASSEMTQVETFEQKQIKDRVWTAVESLPKHERTSVVLYYFGGYSQQEIGEFLELPVSTIKKRLFDSRQRLRDLLEDVVADTLRERRSSRDEKFTDSVLELLEAARTGDVARVKTLLAKKRQLLTARDWLGNSALITAVNSGNHAVAELLYKAGVRADIHEAAAIGDTERVTELLDQQQSLLDSFSAEGFTPVALAAHFGHRETTEFLIDRGADINIVSRHPLGVTPLHASLFGRRIETACLLIERGADVNVKRGGSSWPRAGWTALHYAAAFGMLKVIELLLSHDADVSARDESGETALSVSIAEKQWRSADLLRRKVEERS